MTAQTMMVKYRWYYQLSPAEFQRPQQNHHQEHWKHLPSLAKVKRRSIFIPVTINTLNWYQNRDNKNLAMVDLHLQPPQRSEVESSQTRRPVLENLTWLALCSLWLENIEKRQIEFGPKPNKHWLLRSCCKEWNEGWDLHKHKFWLFVLGSLWLNWYNFF